MEPGRIALGPCHSDDPPSGLDEAHTHPAKPDTRRQGRMLDLPDGRCKGKFLLRGKDQGTGEPAVNADHLTEGSSVFRTFVTSSEGTGVFTLLNLPWI